MMENIFKKTAGVMIATSMLCALFTTGCAGASQSKSDTTPTEGTTEIATEVATEQATEEPTIELLDEPVVIKESSNLPATNIGITIEGRNSNYAYIDTSKMTASEWEYTLNDASTKEIIYITMNYLFNNTDKYGRFEHSDTYLAETVKVSIPYEEGLYVVQSVDGVAYDVNAEYIDGKYVFETNKLGSFMMRTEPIGRTAPTKTTELELQQQTLVDEATGVQVSGMLPVGARVEAEIHYIDNTLFYDRFEEGYLFESDYPEVTDLADWYTVYEYEEGATDVATMISEEGWADHEITAGGKLDIYINVIKDHEILEFESDLTVTLPFDYHGGLAISLLNSEIGPATAVQYNYDTQEFVTLAVTPKENTTSGTFEFKTNAPGQFFLGSSEEIDRFINFYKE